MKVTILQTNIEWGSPLQNIAQAERLMAQNPGADLYVLPEMWSTGFATDPEGIAEDEATSVSRQWMTDKSRELRCAISGSLAIRTPDGRYRNRHYFADGRNGKVTHYDKHHLFTYGGEHRHYASGNEHTVVEYMGFRILLLTCYDLRFPVWSRYSDHLSYDMILCVSNWPESRQNAFQILSRARAIENMAYLVIANRVGDDAYSHYRGCSAVVSPIGKTIAACRANQVDTTTVTLDLEWLQRKRQKFGVLNDRDPFLLESAL